MALYLFALLGILTHFGLLLDRATKKNDFVWQYFIRLNIASFVLSFIISFVLVFQYNIAVDSASEALESVFDKYAWAVQTISFFVGYNAGDIFFRLNKSFGAAIDRVFNWIKGIIKP